MYTAILLNKSDQSELKSRLGFIYGDWKAYCHHVTLNMGPVGKGKNSTELLEKDCIVEVDAVGVTDYAVALRVSSIKTFDGTKLVSTNKTPHITVAVNTENGGKPVMSNDIEFWVPYGPVELCGKLVETGV